MRLESGTYITKWSVAGQLRKHPKKLLNGDGPKSNPKPSRSKQKGDADRSWGQVPKMKR
jgi:hypothetical protein